jgi:signal transduction histidine kinase
LPHVFERFYRVDPARGGETEGIGLGLAIGRSIAESHGGELSIDSKVGEGTSVTLALPATS